MDKININNILNEIRLLLIPKESYIYKTSSIKFINNMELINPRDFFKYREKIEEDISNEIFCENLELSYIQRAFNNCDCIFMLYDQNEIISFLILTLHTPNYIENKKILIDDYKEENYVYIDTICSSRKYKNAGKKLMKLLDIFCKKNNYKILLLDSIDNSYNYFKKLGFLKNIQRQTINNTIPMKKMFQGGKRTKKIINRRFKKSKKARK
jgi:hypothetical protein